VSEHVAKEVSPPVAPTPSPTLSPSLAQPADLAANFAKATMSEQAAAVGASEQVAMEETPTVAPTPGSASSGSAAQPAKTAASFDKAPVGMHDDLESAPTLSSNARKRANPDDAANPASSKRFCTDSADIKTRLDVHVAGAVAAAQEAMRWALLAREFSVRAACVAERIEAFAAAVLTTQPELEAAFTIVTNQRGQLTEQQDCIRELTLNLDALKEGIAAQATATAGAHITASDAVRRQHSLEQEMVKLRKKVIAGESQILSLLRGISPSQRSARAPLTDDDMRRLEVEIDSKLRSLPQGQRSSNTTAKKIRSVVHFAARRYNNIAEVPPYIIDKVAEAMQNNRDFARDGTYANTARTYIATAILSESNHVSGNFVSTITRSLKTAQEALNVAREEARQGNDDVNRLRKDRNLQLDRVARLERAATEARRARETVELRSEHSKTSNEKLNAQLEDALLRLATANRASLLNAKMSPNKDRPTENEVAMAMVTGVIASYRLIASFKHQHADSGLARTFMEFLSRKNVEQILQRQPHLRLPTSQHSVKLLDSQKRPVNFFHCCYKTKGKDPSHYIVVAEGNGKWSCPPEIKNTATEKLQDCTYIFGILTDLHLHLNDINFTTTFSKNVFVKIFANTENNAGAQKWPFALEARHYVPFKKGPLILASTIYSNASLPPNGGSYLSGLNQTEEEIKKILCTFHQWSGRATASSPSPHPFLTSDIDDIAKTVARSRVRAKSSM
jgi:hypothetical protein